MNFQVPYGQVYILSIFNLLNDYVQQELTLLMSRSCASIGSTGIGEYCGAATTDGAELVLGVEYATSREVELEQFLNIKKSLLTDI